MPRVSRVRTAQAQTGAPLTGRLEDCWDEPDASKSRACGDLQLLQGAWTTVSGRRKAEFLVCGSHLTVHFADGAIYMGSILVDPTARPRAMNVRIDEGPEQHRGLVALCVYELDGDTLRWCTSGPGQAQRPGATFEEADGGYLSLVFRREHSNGRH